MADAPEGYLIERSNNQWRVTREEDNAILGHFETEDDAFEAADGDDGPDEDYDGFRAPYVSTEPAEPIQVDEFSAREREAQERSEGDTYTTTENFGTQGDDDEDDDSNV